MVKTLLPLFFFFPEINCAFLLKPLFTSTCAWLRESALQVQEQKCALLINLSWLSADAGENGVTEPTVKQLEIL
ncbi:hypothetical protein V5799_025981 [Amblyomma americanum]|uniref:Secreted protein n=1 Tax=Amblyomma americanum TaxID=6943 RepID=A0AAQ4DJW3_AMBAM